MFVHYLFSIYNFYKEMKYINFDCIVLNTGNLILDHRRSFTICTVHRPMEAHLRDNSDQESTLDNFLQGLLGSHMCRYCTFLEILHLFTLLLGVYNCHQGRLSWTSRL